MSGLVALLHRDGRPVEPGVVWEMLRAIPYRGPDGMWLRVWDDVALGFAKLAITPEEIDEEQPLVSPRTGCAVTADVRLDNRPDLLAQLPDRLPPSTSDAELILRAYETWGTDLVDHLLGDFAVVIWDPRQRQLVLARDTSGQRTLFYRADAHTFAAASEIQQLLQDPAVPVRPNEQRIRAYLTPFWTYQNEKQGTATFYEGILALPPGHAMVVQGRAVRVWRYWELETREIRYRTADEYAEHYLALLSEVVRTRLRTSSPIGALLSGGLDSSSIVAVAHELFRSGSAHNGGFTTFTSAFDGLECDERPLIEDLRDKYGFRAEFVDCGAFGGRLQPEAAGFKESPNMGVGEARDAILGAAHQAGVRVLLTGDTADACVGGTRLVLDSLLRQGQLDAFWHQLRSLRGTTGESLPKILALYCLAPLLPLGLHKQLMSAYLRRTHRRLRHRLLPLWMPPALREELAGDHLRELLGAERGRRFANPTREHEYRLLYPPEVARPLVPWPLEKWTPFTDRRLHEYLLSIPPEQKFVPHPETDNLYAGQKQVVRRAMRGILPESIRTRTLKTHFRAVWENELSQQWPLYQSTFGPGARPEIATRGLVDQGRFWERLQELRSGKFGVDFLYVMNVVSLETWFRGFASPRPQLVTVSAPWNERRMSRRAEHVELSTPHQQSLARERTVEALVERSSRWLSQSGKEGGDTR